VAQQQVRGDAGADKPPRLNLSVRQTIFAANQEFVYQMSIQRIIRKLNELNEANLTFTHLRTATIVRLPFHLCTGLIFEIDDPDNDRLQIWLRNKSSISHNADIHEALPIRSPEEFFTDALIVNGQPEISPGEFEAIRTGKTSAIGFASLRNPGFRLLNEVIAAHQMVRLGPYITGMGALWPRMLTELEVFERILVEVVLLVDPDCTINKDMILRLFDNIDELPFKLGGSGIGDLRNYSREQIAALKLAVRKIRNHAFYELKTNAIAAMLDGNSIVAIVLGCAALEGAHGAFMRITLRDKIPGDVNKFNNFMNGLLREQGFYSLVQLSVNVLMKTEERPSDNELERCLDGITIRNAIMHAGITGTGEYKIRKFSPSAINAGYSGIMAVYRAFEASVESREKSK
jgi:hypothetical protein